MILFAVFNFNMELIASTIKETKSQDKNTSDIKTVKGHSSPEEKEKFSELSKPLHPEVIRILQARNALLNEKLMELDEKKRDMDLVRSEIENRIKELQEIEKRLEQISLEIGLKKKENKEKEKKQREIEERVKNERLQYLAGVYSAMEPSRAAELLNLMEINDVAKIFSHMKTKKVAPIMAQMSPERASAIARALTTIEGKNPTDDDNKTGE